MGNHKLLIFFIYSIVSISSLYANPMASDTLQTNRPKVGLVLSGGGALGFAHIGVLKVLHELNVPVDYVLGTSMGALVGGCFAAGVSPDSIEKRVTAVDINALFDDNPPRSDITQLIKRDDYIPLFELSMGFNDFSIQLPQAASAGYRFELFLNELIGLEVSAVDMDFDALPVPFRAVATDLETGNKVVFEKGRLSRILRASMSLPAVVAPAKIDNRTYIDGGLVGNLPVEEALALGCERLIVVNLGTRPSTIEEITTSIDVASQSFVILTEQNVTSSLSKLDDNDILIIPNLEEFDLTSFSDPDTIIARGIKAAISQKEALSQLAVSDEAYQKWLNKRQSRRPHPLVIKEIKVKTSGAVERDVLLYDVHTKPGKNFHIKTLHKDISEIFGRGDFAYVSYSVVPDKDAADIIIEAEHKPWGPGYLKFGFGTATDFSSATQINLAMSYRRTWINRLGAEWRTDLQIGNRAFIRTEYTQPLQIRDGAFISPYLYGNRNTIQFYIDDERLGDYINLQAQAGIDIGLASDLGEVRVGPYIKAVDSSPEFGIVTSALPDYSVQQRGIRASAIYDQLDRIVFPRHGMFIRGDINYASTRGDYDFEYTRAQILATAVQSFSKNIFSLNLEWGRDLNEKNNLLFHDLFSLGGLYHLSGLYLDQRTGTKYELATVKYYRQYANLPPQLGYGMYFGLSLEAGRINDPFIKDTKEMMYAGSIFWGADTILGPFYLGYGYTSTKEGSWYLIIGPRF